METDFGSALKDWRSRRRMSQLDLGLTANVSARHISFLETGRAQPSRSMVIQLCETLDIPRIDRNTLLNVAGFAPSYSRRELDDADMAHVRAAVDWTLERHDPFPAMAVDRHWTLIRCNKTAIRLMTPMGACEGDSLLDLMTDSNRMSVFIENWPEVARHMIQRFRTESAHLGGDPVLDQAASKLAEEFEPEDGNGVLPAVVPTRYSAGGMTLSFFSTIAQFGTAEDIALAELKIEMMFPADDATREMLLTMGDKSS